MNRSILLVFAHPDDESFGIASTVAKYSEQGVPVDLICATRGEEGTRLGLSAGVETGKAREAELCTAAAIIGIRTIYFLGYHDGKLAQVNRREVTERVESLMSLVRPEVVITFGPDGITGHPDHIAIGEAATSAFHRLNGKHGWPRKLYYVTISESAIPGEAELSVATRPDHEVTAIDIGDYLDLKIKAIAAHRSQQDAQEFISMLRDNAMNAFARNEFFYLANVGATEKESDLFQ